MSEYDASDNAVKCYAVAIDAMREELASFRKEQIGDCTIYDLRDPRTGEVRYVGKTVLPLSRRLTSHISAAKGRSHRRVCRWIRSLLDVGLVPMIHALEVVPAGGDWAEREAHFIGFYRSRGCDLTNHTDGGEGLPGLVFSEEHRRKISIKLRTGKTFNCETCGTAFWRKQAEIKKGNNRFCSRNCYTRSLKGKTRPVPQQCTQRGVKAAAAEKLARTRCKRGHPLSGPNLFITSNGGRGCKECRKIHKRNYRERCSHVAA